MCVSLSLFRVTSSVIKPEQQQLWNGIIKRNEEETSVRGFHFLRAAARPPGARDAIRFLLNRLLEPIFRRGTQFKNKSPEALTFELYLDDFLLFLDFLDFFFFFFFFFGEDEDEEASEESEESLDDDVDDDVRFLRFSGAFSSSSAAAAATTTWRFGRSGDVSLKTNKITITFCSFFRLDPRNRFRHLDQQMEA